MPWQITDADRTHLRELASRVAEIAADPVQDERREIWYAQNALDPIRPPVYVAPDYSWEELIPEETLACEGDYAREIELALRKRIYAHEHFGDDQVVDAQWSVPHALKQTGWGVGRKVRRPELRTGAHAYDTAIESMEDIERLQTPTAEHDPEESERRIAWHEELFGDILQVRLHALWWWSLGLMDEWTPLRGIEQTYLDMMDNPELVHAGMRRLMEGRLAWLDQLEAEGVLSLNNGNDYVGSGCFGFSRELPQQSFEGHVRPIDMWGFAEAQTMAAVSPAMHEEFVLRYQLPILERFGLNCYGCCEPLDRMLETLLSRVPRLRRVSISAWADVRRSAEQLGDRAIFSWKPDPAMLAAVTFDEQAMRTCFREALDICAENGCLPEIVMRTTHTCNRRPERFDRCARIAMEEATRGA